MQQEIKRGKYRHFKGNEYEVLCVAKHSETEEPMVVYRALYGDGDVWVRPASMWTETVVRDGVEQPRFSYFENNFLLDIRDYLQERELWGRSGIEEAIAERNAGKKYSINDHIRGLVHSQLTSQSVWSRVEPHLEEIDELMYGYDPELLKKADPKELERNIKELKCGNRTLSRSMKVLADNICQFEKIEDCWSSIDNFILSDSPEKIVKMLSDEKSTYKLKMVGDALAWEYLRNVGIDGAKPDTHLRRMLSSSRMGTGAKHYATVKETVAQVEKLSAETGLLKATVDKLIWTFCSEKNGEICTKTPHCNRCPLQQRCNYNT